MSFSSPAVLEYNVWCDSLVLHQNRDQAALHLRSLAEHRLDGNLGQSEVDKVNVRSQRVMISIIFPDIHYT